MLVIPSIRHYLFNLGCRNIPCIESTDATTFYVYFEHDLRGLFSVFGKKYFKYIHNEIHRSEIVIEEHYRIERRRREFGAFSLEYLGFLMLFCHKPILTSLFECAKRLGGNF